MEKLINQFKALPSWQRYVLLVAMPVFLIFYLWFTMLSPALDEKQKLQGDIKNLKTDIERLKASLDPKIIERLRKQEEGLKEEYSKQYKELTNLVGEIPSEKDMGVVLRNIGRIAQKSGVAIIGMEMGNPEKVDYHLVEEAGKKIVKEVPKAEESRHPQQAQAQQPAQQQTKKQQSQQKTEGVTFIRSELKLSLLGSHTGVRDFLNGLKREGVISYPHEMSITNEGSKLKTDIKLYLLMREAE
ncbi:MAG: hypothetical protein N3D14_01695 [Aquificaceae bacterium]|nr:hypothetical protein [Aquificaceae bacterium]